MEWFPITLLCAFSLASADAMTKRWLGDYGGRELVLVRLALPALLLVPLAWANPLPAVPLPFWGWIGVLVPLELAAMLLYVVAIRDAPLHLTLPYLAFTPVFNVATGYLLLGETVSLRGFGGILLVVGGAYLLDLKRGGNGGWLAPVRALLSRRGSRLMLAVAAIYSLTSVMGKQAMQYADPLSFGAFYYPAVGAGALLFALLHRPALLGALVRRPLANLAVGAAMALMVVTHFLAIAQVEVAYMIAVKRTSLLFGILYGALLFGERDLVRNLGAGSLMVAGVALIIL
ncbi:EamA family transporter [Endothiovibrio diazotrophicus]